MTTTNEKQQKKKQDFNLSINVAGKDIHIGVGYLRKTDKGVNLIINDMGYLDKTGWKLHFISKEERA